MDIVKTAVDVLNPGQIPVLTCDHGKADPMELAYKVWRGSIHSDVWWPTHRDGVPQGPGRSSGGQRLEHSFRPGLLPVEQQFRF
ncbi:hypothetical protein HOLleu_01188 [Holothuria leucospilota]|uniref:Uncharacterized protein n=1 Tax=Holothuria leucospilota TaxID=206669 RepID=A0A9Q1HKP6_HOLLE|nr:hypothetical protein HOLleu_01188 [Holothuria leucospilota]